MRSSLAAALMAAVTAAAALVGGCGGGSECGNGVAESGEQCDDGNIRDDDGCSNTCKAQQTRDAQLIWSMVAKELIGFSESCTGVAAATVHLVVTGPVNLTLDKDCNDSQTKLMALDPGHYTVNGTLFDAAHTALTKGGAMAEFDISSAPPGPPVQVTVDFPFADFVRAYQGNWLYRLKWAGAATCAAAAPPVVNRTIRIERAGVPVMSSDGVTLDGMTPEPCTDPSSAPQIKNLPWGPANVIITGLDGASVPRFRQSFPTFLGAGILNPILNYDVASLAPDAGVPDAGVPDAGP